jgi:hypothetical protein
VVWLGESDDDGDKALRYIQKAAATLQTFDVDETFQADIVLALLE